MTPRASGSDADPSLRYLARQLQDLRRRVAASERSARGQRTSIGIATSEDDDAPVVDLDVSGALWTGVEASVDAMAAQDTANRAARTFNQGTAPTPAQEPDGIIPPGSLWNDTSNGNRPYRWSGSPTDGVWVQQPVGQGALDAQLLALVLGRFATLEERDALIPTPQEGQKAFVVATNLDYQYASGQWVPMLQFVRKNTDQANSSTTLAADTILKATLVPGWYRIEALLHLRGDSTGDMVVRWSYSGVVATGDSRLCLGPSSESNTGASTTMRSTGNNYASSIRYGVTDSASDVAVREDLLFQVTSTGVLQLWFAQAQSAPGSVTMGAQSRLFITKVY